MTNAVHLHPDLRYLDPSTDDQAAHHQQIKKVFRPVPSAPRLLLLPLLQLHQDCIIPHGDLHSTLGLPLQVATAIQTKLIATARPTLSTNILAVAEVTATAMVVAVAVALALVAVMDALIRITLVRILRTLEVTVPLLFVGG
jgi:hypothetical protein